MSIVRRFRWSFVRDMASNNALPELCNLLKGDLCLERKREYLDMLRAKYIDIISSKAKEAVNGTAVPSLAICEFSNIQFPYEEGSRCPEYLPVR